MRSLDTPPIRRESSSTRVALSESLGAVDRVARHCRYDDPPIRLDAWDRGAGVLLGNGCVRARRCFRGASVRSRQHRPRDSRC